MAKPARCRSIFDVMNCNEQIDRKRLPDQGMNAGGRRRALRSIEGSESRDAQMRAAMSSKGKVSAYVSSSRTRQTARHSEIADAHRA